MTDQNQDEDKIQKATFSSLWQKLKRQQIGVVSFPVYVLFASIIFLGIYTEVIPTDLLGGVAVIMALGWALGAIGDAIPIVNKLGGGTILAIVIPSLMVLFNILPQNTVDAVNLFMGDINFQNLYIFTMVSGSILGMNRNVLVQGFSRMAIPMATGFVLALLIPTTIGWALGLGFKETLFFIVTPALSGGVSGGVLPLSLGYSEVMGIPYGEMVALLTPASVLVNFFVIGGAAIANIIGEYKQNLTGNGTYIRTANEEDDFSEGENYEKEPISYQLIGTGLFLVAAFYIGGRILEKVIGLPTAVIVIFAVTLLKYFRVLPKQLELSTVQFYKAISTTLNVPMMVGVGVVFLTLEDIIGTITWQYLVVLFSVAVVLGLTGFFMSRFNETYPVEATLISLNQAAMGGVGSISILATADREEMMPYAQVANRLGGAFTIAIMSTLIQFFF